MKYPKPWETHYKNGGVKFLATKKVKCPKCKGDLSPSDVRGYRYVCHNCDENFFECEV